MVAFSQCYHRGSCGPYHWRVVRRLPTTMPTNRLPKFPNELRFVLGPNSSPPNLAPTTALQNAPTKNRMVNREKKPTSLVPSIHHPQYNTQNSLSPSLIAASRFSSPRIVRSPCNSRTPSPSLLGWAGSPPAHPSWRSPALTKPFRYGPSERSKASAGTSSGRRHTSSSSLVAAPPRGSEAAGPRRRIMRRMRRRAEGEKGAMQGQEEQTWWCRAR